MNAHGQEVCAASYEGFLRSGRGAVMLNFNIETGASAASDKTAASAGLLNGVAGDMPWIFLPLSAISATQQRLVAQKARRALASSSLLLSSLFSLRASLSVLSSLFALRFSFSSLFSLSSLLAPTFIIRSARRSPSPSVRAAAIRSPSSSSSSSFSSCSSSSPPPPPPPPSSRRAAAGRVRGDRGDGAQLRPRGSCRCVPRHTDLASRGADENKDDATVVACPAAPPPSFRPSLSSSSRTRASSASRRRGPSP